MYAATALAGVGFFPGAVLGIIVAKDDAQSELKVGFDKVFNVSVAFIKEKGFIKKVEREQGMILGKIEGTDILLNLRRSHFLKLA